MGKIFSYLFFVCCISVLFSCEKEYSVELGKETIANGSLWDSTGNCLPEIVHGTFYNGVIAGKDTAYVEVQVNVAQTGSYSITSDLQNGFQFLDSGFFSNTGINTIHLKPIGAAILPVPTTFNISFDSSFCSFIVNVQDSTGTGLGGGGDTTGTDTTQKWQFTQDTTYGGVFTSATKDNSSGVVTIVLLAGATSTGDTTLSLQFIIDHPDIQPGTYTLVNNAIMFSLDDILNLTTLYTADAFTTGSDMTITVTSYNSATNLMQATFTGTALDKSGNLVPITNGLFTVKVQ